MRYRTRRQRVVSGFAGVAGALLLPVRVQTAVGTGWLVGLVGAGAVSSALLLVINAALLGVRRADLSLLASVLGSLSRLVIVAALLVLGIVATSSGATAAHTILVVWVASLMLSLGLGGRLLVRAHARVPLPVRLDLAVPAATRIGLGSPRHARWPAARLRAADSRLRAVPARPSRLCVHGDDDRSAFYAVSP